MKGIILYKTQYGSTRQYAEWLSEEISIPVVNLSNFKNDDIDNYDFFIIGSNIKVGKITAASWIRNNFNYLKDKSIILFSVCGSYADPTEQTKVLKDNLPGEIRNSINYFALPGKLDKDNLDFWDNFIIKMVSKFYPDKEAAERMTEGFDWIDRNKLAPIINIVEKYNIGIYE
jgi:menaquinone-dependent protoporphyrinogen IX oxidase